MGVTEQLYFPTPIYTGWLRQASEINPQLLELIYTERERDAAGTQRSVFRELNGWHSEIKLHLRPEFSDFVGAVENELDYISADSGYDPAYRLKITTMWAITNGYAGMNRSHVHPNADWSGVYYVQTPPRCGNIEFVDPRSVYLMTQPRFRRGVKRKKSRWTKVNFTPEPGKILFFPSWLYHSVAPNLTEVTGREGDRVVISFNIRQTKRK